jgi:tRNA pseudouridine38-40 synthase
MRYFIELSYHGHGYAGFQIQDNALTVQYELQRAMETILRVHILLTGSSRTDAGVHARQNFFHFDLEKTLTDKQVYNLNAVLPATISVKSIRSMPETAHSRFDAIGRRYQYFLYSKKNPFYADRGWHYPYPLNIEMLQSCAGLLMKYKDFTSFSKRNTQAKTMICNLNESYWRKENDQLIFAVTGNRFLRGMVRGLVATMLMAGRGKITLADFEEIIKAKDCSKADFAAPAHGLFLEEVRYPEGYFDKNES